MLSSESYLYLTIGLASGFFLGFNILRRASRRTNRLGLLKLVRNMASDTDIPSELQNLADLASQEECKMVFVVRTDLKMGTGKIAAQCAHAAIANYEVTAERCPQYLIAWREMGQTKITLKGESEEQLLTLQKAADSLGLVAEIIHDAGRTQIAAGSATVLGIGPAPRSLVDQVTDNYIAMNKAPLFCEFSSSSGYVPPKSYALSDDKKSLVLLKSSDATGEISLLLKLKLTLVEIFLPYGYPNSVSEDYLAYQFWDTVQAFCSSLVGTLATHAVLTGLGVGSEDATPMAATLTWLAKDGLGMVGRITFVWFKGCDLDNDLKRWRFVADILNDAAFFVDMLSAAVPRVLFPAMVCFSSASRAIVGVAGGATRTALVQHQARHGNAADVSAKDGSQETVVNLTALIVSLFLVPAVEGQFYVVWFLYALLTFFHLFANYRAVKALRLRTFNDKRLGMAVKSFLSNGSIPDVNEINNAESILQFNYSFKNGVRVGVSLSELLDNFGWASETWFKLQSLFGNEKFVIITNAPKRMITVVLSKHAEAKDIIFCNFVCHLIDRSSIFEQSNTDELAKLAEIYKEASEKSDSFFKNATSAGWNITDHNLTIAGQYRFDSKKSE